ncbi:universal stress protein [Shewanella atlantica]|uniref:universal stress protein n=1 Tax=Shewanella atlantica TaxID=271099 RepID=UPI00373594C7
MDKVFIISQKEEAHTDAIAAGVELAKAMDKQAEVFAYNFEYFSGAEYYSPRLGAAAQQKIMKDRAGKIEEELKALKAEDVPVHTVWSKDLHEHACHHSIRHGFDLMVKAIHHADHYLPVDWNLIRHVKIPLMLLTDNPLHRGNAVLIAVDLGSDNHLKQQLNQAVISHGRALAKASGSKLHLAFVIRVPRVLRDMDLINTSTLVKDAYQEHQEQISKLNMDPDCVHIIAGDPDICLYELSCRLKARYLVLGARQRQGVLGYVIGNMAESILSRIRSNVLIIPADDQLLAPLNSD